MIFNAGNNEIPMLDRKYISYKHPMTFDSPYLKSKYKSGKIHIKYAGEALDLDFSKHESKELERKKYGTE